jgi:CHAT domain/Transposase
VGRWFSGIAIIAGRERRYTAEQKLQLVEETLQPGRTFSAVARLHDVSPSLLFKWRQLMSEARVRDLERLLGRKTLVMEVLRLVFTPRSRCSATVRVLVFALVGAICVDHTTRAAPEDALAAYHTAIANYQEQFRKNGPQGATPYATLNSIEAGLQAITNESTGSLRARALLELGRVQRMGTRYEAAIGTLTEAARLANAAALPDTEFDAWLNIARAHVIGTHDFGAADDAIARAEDIAGKDPNQQQQFDLGDLRSILYESRGEAEAALIQAIPLRRLAIRPTDRYFARRDFADALKKIFYRCQHEALTDAKSNEPGADPRWGACNRAMFATQEAYNRTGAVAAELSWSYLARQAWDEARSTEFLYGLWHDQWTQLLSALPAQKVFHPKAAKDVLASEIWTSATSADVPDAKPLGPIIDETLAESRRLSGRVTARDLSVEAGRPGTDRTQALRLLAQATAILQSERHSFFDARRRGTAIEDYTDVPLALALQYLSLRQTQEAFDAFESMRARGLTELNQILQRPGVSIATRRWLAALLVEEARVSSSEKWLVEKVIAGGDPDSVEPQLDELQLLRAGRASLIVQGADEIARLQQSDYRPAHLGDLQIAARKADVSVMLYWSTETSVVAWYVGPNGSEVRNIFLPASVLQDDVLRMRKSVGTTEPPKGAHFDEAPARELYLFLIAPFEHLLDGKQVMIVPQGPLIDLPFEMLLMPDSDKPLIERWAVSYMPNATMALQALRRPVTAFGRTSAVFDPDIDARTKESRGLRDVLGPTLQEVSFDTLLRTSATADMPNLVGTTGLHILMHGTFDSVEPLMSRIRDDAKTHEIIAAEMIGLPLQGWQLAVLSSCETGRVGTRLSNEIYGFPWVLLAGGVSAAVVSRWQILGTSNSEWMRLFYAAAKAGDSPALAGAKAMRGLRAAGYTHPYYWAAMQVTGR